MIWTLNNPRLLFKLDASGALLSAIMLGVVLTKFESTFGIPASSLYVLTFFPCLFVVYDIFCLSEKNPISGLRLQGIAFMNLFYCFLSIGFALYHIREIKAPGWAYLIIEIALVLAIATVEYRLGKKLIFESGRNGNQLPDPQK